MYHWLGTKGVHCIYCGSDEYRLSNGAIEHQHRGPIDPVLNNNAGNPKLRVY